jgi:serine/threonine protein phosphatase PrpC
LGRGDLGWGFAQVNSLKAEDRVLCLPELSGRLGGAGIFAVFDGHAGCEAAEFCARSLGPLLEEGLPRAAEEGAPVEAWAGEVRAALGDAFEALDVEHGRAGFAGGCTATAVVVHSARDGWLVTSANVGDSHAVLVTPGEAEEVEGAPPSPAGGGSSSSPESANGFPPQVAGDEDPSSLEGSLDGSRASSFEDLDGANDSGRDWSLGAYGRRKSGRGTRKVRLTECHRLEGRTSEQERVLRDSRAESLGLTLGRVKSEAGEAVGPLRVWPGGLSMSRSIGDSCYGAAVSSRPSITQRFVPYWMGGRIVVCSDGVWDVLSKHHFTRLGKANGGGLGRSLIDRSDSWGSLSGLGAAFSSSPPGAGDQLARSARGGGGAEDAAVKLCTLAANEHYRRFWRPKFPGEFPTNSAEYVTDDISVVCVDLYRDESTEPQHRQKRRSWHQPLGRFGLRRLFMSEENLQRLAGSPGGGTTPPLSLA